MKKFLKHSARLLGYLGIILIICAALIYLYQTYSIKKVEVIVVAGDITNVIGVSDLYGQNTLLLSEKQIQKDLQKRNPGLQSVSVSRSFPSTLKISVNARKPLAALQVSDNGVFIIDKDGVILLRQKNYNGPLPLLKYYQTFQYKEYQVGNKIDYKDIVTALFFADELAGYGYPSQRIDIDGQYMIRLTIIDKKTFFFTTEKEKEIQMYQLKELLQQFKMQGKDFKTIDLRFDKPVITVR